MYVKISVIPPLAGQHGFVDGSNSFVVGSSAVGASYGFEGQYFGR